MSTPINSFAGTASGRGTFTATRQYPWLFFLNTSPCSHIRAIDRPILASWDVELTHALHHDPQLKARGFSWSLNVGRVDQFGFQRTRVMSGFAGPSSVVERATIRPANKFPSAFRRRASAFLTQHGCAFRVKPRKESRQETERIRLIRCREQFQFVTESYRMHEKQSNRKTPPCKISLASHTGPERLRNLRPLRASPGW